MIYTPDVIQAIHARAETATSEFERAKERLELKLACVSSGLYVTTRAMKLANNNYDRKETAYRNAMQDLADAAGSIPSKYFQNS